jgi:hypothetical protein
MRYDENLTTEAITGWAIKNFKNVINVYNFSNSFVILCSHEIVLVHKNNGAVEVISKHK